MFSRSFLALFALTFPVAHAQVWVNIVPRPDSNEIEDIGEVEKRYTSELVAELQSAKDDVLLLYTEYSARSGAELKMFLRNISGLTNETVSALDPRILTNASEPCRSTFEKRLKKIEYDAHRAASFSTESHHKFLLGHVIVFRMHLNKSEDYIKKCEKVVKDCGIKCESIGKVSRWRRLAKEEIYRVRDDLQHSRLSYRDIVVHAHRKLNQLRRQATARAQLAVRDLEQCTRDNRGRHK